jgi:hypothetical protein
MYVYEPDNLRIRYVARPSGGLFYFNGGRVKVLPKYTLRQVPFLSMSLRSYLIERESVDLLTIMECLDFVSAFDWLKCIVNRQQRWWIGSFLDALEPHLSANENSYEYTCWLFQKMLRGLGCGKSIPAAQFRLVDFEMPVRPASDVGTEMGLWLPDEAQFMLQVIEYAQSLVGAGLLAFKTPPEPVGLAPAETDEEWHTWVSARLAELRSATEMAALYPDVALVSFID